jgi:hypothetical protein
MLGIRLLAFLLIAEGVSTLFWLVMLLPSLGWRDRSSVAVIVVRGVVGALQLVSGWGLASRNVSAPALACWALGLSAALLPLEIGFHLSPSNLDPTYRWPLVWAYAVYALVAIFVLRPKSSDSGPGTSDDVDMSDVGPHTWDD